MHSWLITMLKYIKYLYFHVFFVQCVVDLRLQGSSNVWVLPEYSQEFPLNCAHLFCGAFSAWERAISGCYNISTSAYNNRYQLIGTKRLCRCGNWEHVRPFSKPLSATMWLFMILKRGILGNIENDDWMNIFRHQTNLIFTMSPPCQPWSLGGKGQGFYPSMVCAWLTPSRKFDELDRFAFVLNVLTR